METNTRCGKCTELSIDHLLALAEEYPRFQGEGPVDYGYYQHHASITDLEESANHGCDLCQFLVSHLKGLRWVTGGRKPYYDPDFLEGSSDSVYDSVKRHSASDVRIAIGALRQETPSLADIDVFDCIRVQFGPSEPLDSAWHGWNYTQLLIRIEETVLDIPLSVRGLPVGRRAIGQYLGSPTNFGIAEHWLRECEERHDDCSVIPKAPVLPTRVIDVGVGTDNLSLHYPHGAAGRYVALSHCWGGRITPTLSASTHDPFLRGIPYDQLPANFQDAVVITRRLGIRYLWIDSLCIIQDSVQDWLEESKKMGGIYEDATLTIAAMTSSKSTDGILGTNQTKAKQPDSVSIPALRAGDRTVNARVEALPKKKDQEYLADLITNSVLASRGWTLQESVLSARVLFFGAKQIYWRCHSGFQYADGRLSQLGEAWVLPDFPDLKDSCPAMRSYQFSSAVGRPLSNAGVDEKEAILEEYYHLVHDYTRRLLTVVSDKLPAFSGLAQRTHRAVGGAYLAGLLSDDIKRSLLFYPSVSFDSKPAATGMEYRAPSWSWASLDHSIRFVNDLDASGPLDLRIINHKVTLRKDDNPYGEVTGAHLVVEGVTVPLYRSAQLFKTGGYFAYEGWSRFDSPVHGRWIPVANDSIRGRHIVECVADITGIEIETEEADLRIDPQAYLSEEYVGLFVTTGSWGDLYFLILEPAASEGPKVYRRAGFLSLPGHEMEWISELVKEIITMV
ncbi:heterokaryon incompatibility protein-domain-containing protein [Immersiella caudata]|uniref:Heterokaryon incompatibility protein-domain-containing protein n=1 Tax=Immersiella caudata TaxID=314043 RepID=A0AA39WJC0_9PEZI|nr:heterokaryon incompatibility protein-domain-containing protein [Immersiella caudata]